MSSTQIQRSEVQILPPLGSTPSGLVFDLFATHLVRKILGLSRGGKVGPKLLRWRAARASSAAVPAARSQPAAADRPVCEVGTNDFV